MPEPMPHIDVTELKRRIDEGRFARGEAVLLDVREPNEHAVCALPGATLVPMREVPAAVDDLPRDREVVVYCKVGGRSAQVVAFLRAKGVDATNVAGGIKAWAEQVDPALPRYW